jgi:hypothetical protein
MTETSGGGEVRIEGLDELVRTLKRAGRDIDDLKDAHIRAGQMVAAEAASLAPRLSGALSGSIRSAKQARRARVQAGGARVPYAGAIHWGWPARGISENPFLTDAAQSTESRWTAGYLKDVEAALNKVRGT